MTPTDALHIIDTYCIPTAYPHTERWEQLQEIKEAYMVLVNFVNEHENVRMSDKPKKYWICQNCGLEVHKDYKNCPRCGEHK